MMRRYRCTKCTTTFYTAQSGVRECQNCSGDLPDTSMQAERDVKNIQLANSNPKGAPQSVDPRTGLPKVTTVDVAVPQDAPVRRKRRSKAKIEADNASS